MARKPSKQAGMAELAAMRAAAAMTAADFRAADKDGLGWGLELHRYVEPRDWPRALEERVPAEHRAAAEAYLRGIADRMRTLQRMARDAGHRSVEEWKASRRAQERDHRG